MNIRFTSTLTSEDENRLAPAVLSALSGILDLLPIAYVLEIETSDLHRFQQGCQGDLRLLEPHLLDAHPSSPVTMES